MHSPATHLRSVYVAAIILFAQLPNELAHAGPTELNAKPLTHGIVVVLGDAEQTALDLASNDRLKIYVQLASAERAGNRSRPRP